MVNGPSTEASTGGACPLPRGAKAVHSEIVNRGHARPIRLGLACALALTLGGATCGDSGSRLDREHEGPAGPGGVGAACARDSDCLAELLCVAELPGGFCTRRCIDACPGRSLCVRTVLPDGDEVLACAPVCGACRDGYRCVSVGRESVCSF